MPSLAATIVFFVVGYLCGCCSRSFYKLLKKKENFYDDTDPPVYTEVPPAKFVTQAESQKEEFELEDNIVYDSIIHVQ